MSDRSSPANGGYESAEPTGRLSVRKDLFPEVLLSKLAADEASLSDGPDGPEDVEGVKLETDFEQSIDDIQRQQSCKLNGTLPSNERTRHQKHKKHSHRDSDRSKVLNGFLQTDTKKRKRSSESKKHKKHSHSILPLKVKGGKNLNLVSSSECQQDEEEEEEEGGGMDDPEVGEESSEDEVLKCSVKLPVYSVQRQSGKPYSHELSQLSSKKSKRKDSKEKRTHTVIPCSGKPRSMLDICSSRKKKSRKKAEQAPTYQSLIMDTNTNLKIKISRTGLHELVCLKSKRYKIFRCHAQLRRGDSSPQLHLPRKFISPIVTPATPVAPVTSISDLGQRKSKKKRAASPVASESSGEEYDPSKKDTAAVITVAAPKPRHPPAKTKKTTAKHKGKSEKTETSRVSAQAKVTGPQSPWAQSMPEEVLVKIFEYVVHSQGTLPAAIRLGRVCKLWHSVSCSPELWLNVDLAQYTVDKCKTDYKLVWLLENRLSKCQNLNIAHWKVANMSWVLACVADYCPALNELSLAGWSRLLPEQLFDLFQTLPKLQRIDLSHVSETGGSGTCLSAASVARVVESFGERLTHLTLANNMFTALQQILTSIAAHCPNLEVLDISGVRATSHPAAVPLEALQKGCPKVRVLRAANAQLVLAPATNAQQAEVSGWSQLEELSIAGEAATERVVVGQYRLGDEELGRLVKGAHKLRLLDLRGLGRLTDSGLVRVPAWDLQHLFLGGCNVTRQSSACLELICEKWSHSLIELDLSWASAARVLDVAVAALADSAESKLRVLNLCGSSVSLEPVKKVLRRCLNIESLNLSACRALPRGMKRLYTGRELQDLKDSLDPDKAKTKEQEKKEAKNKEADSKIESTSKDTPKHDASDASDAQSTPKSGDKSPTVFQEPRSVTDISRQSTDISTKPSPDGKESSPAAAAPSPAPAPSPASRPDSSSQPSPAPPPPDPPGPWSLGHFKTTPTHKSEASPLNRPDTHSKFKQNKVIEQCSPTTSQETRPSPEIFQSVKQDIKNPNSYYGGYSPMTRQENQFSSQRSPYSAAPSPAQPSPYSAQPSPYSAQPSPYSSQPSPYSAQPSPDTSQMVKQDLQKSGGSGGSWNTGGYSPMTKHPAPFSPHPSPEPGLGAKPTPNKTPGRGQYSPMSRQDRIHQSPYSPRSGAEQAYSNKRSPGAATAAQLRPDCQLARPAAAAAAAAAAAQAPGPLPELSSSWFSQVSSGGSTPSLESLVWGSGSFVSDAAAVAAAAAQQAWPLPAMAGTGGSGLRRDEELVDPWTLGQFRLEPPHNNNTFVEQSVSFESLSAHLGSLGALGAAQHLPSFLEDGFSESRVD